MSDISTKLQYLNTTKGKIKDVINMTGANITSDTTFRNYATKLYDGYVNVLKDKNTLLDNMLKGTSTGYITDAADLPVYEDKMSKESTQDGTPTPDNPVEVKTVKGYRNLFDIADGTYTVGTSPSASITFKDGVMTSLTHNYSQNFGINIPLRTPITLKANTTYTRANYSNYAYPYITLRNGTTSINSMVNSDNGVKSFTPTEDIIIDNISLWFYYVYNYTELKPMMLEGEAILPHVPYGNNYVAITNTNGTDTNYYTLPLNGNEICGIGNYKDELIVDKNGKCWLNKKTVTKQISSTDIGSYAAVSQGSLFRTYSFNDIIASSFTTKCNYYLGIINATLRQNYNVYWNRPILAFDFIDNRFDNLEDFKNWVDTVNLKVLGILNEPQLIDLNYTVDIELFKGINNISNSDDMDMEIKYIKDTYE